MDEKHNSVESLNKLLGDRSRTRSGPLHKLILPKTSAESSILACGRVQRRRDPPPMSSPLTNLITRSFQKSRPPHKHSLVEHLPLIRQHRYNMEGLVEL